jgi:aminoglycoside phosphotransferase
MTSIVAAFIARRWCVPSDTFRVDVRPMRGGLESTVARARISMAKRARSIPSCLVVKQLPVGGEREADVYDALWRQCGRPPAARVLGVDVTAEGTYLYLENVHSSGSWPWAETSMAGAVCRELARFHDMANLPTELFAWDYETELARSAESTLQMARDARDPSGRRWWRRLGDLRRVTLALPFIRARLLSDATVIHGDVHPGNVIVREDESDRRPVLIDWGRARLGSRMEDVASWLHSLGCWEPEARRRHDTLMRAYLQAARTPRSFTSDMRVDYWLASASNGLSGAIRYHLSVLSAPRLQQSARDHSRRALIEWQRAVRRAAALLSTNLER